MLTWPITSHTVTEVIRATCVAAGAQHLIQAARTQRGIPREGLLDEGDIGIEHRGAHILPSHRDAGLREHAPHGVTVHVELAGKRADTPALRVIQPQDLGLELARDHRRTARGRLGELSAPLPQTQTSPPGQLRPTERAMSPGYLTHGLFDINTGGIG
jgi:hypothetical protein